MSIVYDYFGGLYINITNRCPARCEFCIKNFTGSLGSADSLVLDREPTVDEVIEELKAWNVDSYDEVVFCGYGEPTCRLYDMLEVCRRLKEITATPIRVNTNGHASLILKENTPPLFKGLVDCVSISLNAADPDTYVRLCRPRFGEDAYTGMLKFAREVVYYVPKVILTAIRGTVPDEDLERCAEIAREIGAGFRIRDLIEK